MRRLSCLVLAGCAAGGVASAPTPAWVAATGSIQPGTPATPTLVQTYSAVATRIITYARADHGAYAKLSELTDGIGARLAGSHELDRAIEWASATMTADGHDVRTEPVMVPHWVRGVEEASIVSSPLAPVETPPAAPVALNTATYRARPLRVLGLGGSVGTPLGGVTAPIVVVTSWDDLAAKATSVKGAIVVYDVAMPEWNEAKGFSGYGETVPYRTDGAAKAAALGAVAVLVRSVTAHSLGTLHTGWMRYDDAQPKIPAASITTEDADLLARLAARGPTTVKLRMDEQTLADVPSANVIGELRGTDLADQVIVLGAHLDSWDVGQGAHDDGAGCVIMMQALTTLRKLGLHPRRTIRVVLFANEENGGRGAKAYAKDHAAELANTVLAVESDSGGFAPVGFSIDVADDAAPERAPTIKSHLAPIMDLLEPFGLMKLSIGHSGSDIHPMVAGGVPALGLIVASAPYFDIHHTSADTLDKVAPQDLSDSSAAVAVLAYVAASLPDRLDAP